jgi:hypothetical protein
MQCHNVSHVSKLKICHSPDYRPYTIPGRIAPPHNEFIVDSILDFRISHSASAGCHRLTLAFLTHFDGYDSTHDSWERYSSLKHVEVFHDLARSSIDLI